MIRFDLSKLAKDSDLKKATLNLYINDEPRPEDNNFIKREKVRLYKSERMWKANRTTWNFCDVRERIRWGTPGGDFSEDGLLDTSALEIKETGWDSFDVTKAVKEYMKDPKKNKGFILVADTVEHDGNSTELRLYAMSENTKKEFRPKLTLEGVTTPIKTVQGFTQRGFALVHNNKGLTLTSKNEKIRSISIVSIAGKTIRHQKVPQKKSQYIDMSDLSVGSYFVVINNVYKKLLIHR